MIFLKLEQTETNIAKVEMVHYFPEMLGESEKSDGIMVESVPEPSIQAQKTAVLFFDKGSKELYYEYIDRPLTQEEQFEQMKQQQSSLEQKTDQAIMELTMIIAMGGSV